MKALFSFFFRQEPFYCREDKRQIEQDSEAGIPALKGMVPRASQGSWLLSRQGGGGMGCGAELYFITELCFG